MLGTRLHARAWSLEPAFTFPFQLLLVHSHLLLLVTCLVLFLQGEGQAGDLTLGLLLALLLS